jgi:ubiquinone/menaquinone biosynthesis C-methylase UbiE
MEPRLQRRVQRYGWDKAAHIYEQAWQRQLEPAQTKLLEMADLQPGERVLDIACGTGLVTFPAAEKVGSEGEVIGTDISEKMVAAAREVATNRNIGNTAFQRMEAEEIQFPEGSFDVALCALGLMYVPDTLKAVQEMQRVLKSDGRAVAAVWGQRNRCGWADVFPIVDARVESEVCPLFFLLGTVDVLQQKFETARFTDVLVERLPTILHYDSPEDACGAAFAAGPVALAYSRFDDRTRDEANTEYLASIEPYRKGDGYDVPGEFVIASGRKP